MARFRFGCHRFEVLEGKDIVRVPQQGRRFLPADRFHRLLPGGGIGLPLFQ